MSRQMEIKSHRRNYVVDFLSLTKNLIHTASNDSFLVIDANVNRLYPEFGDVFNKNRIFEIDAIEEKKTLNTCQTLIEFLLKANVKRNHKLIAVGGGITQDIVAFTASVLYRGIEWEFFPTTLLAQADSCIGSKTSINFQSVKNLLGTFYPPSKIYCCIEFLSTLDEDDIKSGIGEMLHYFLIDCPHLAAEMMNTYGDNLKRPHLLKKHIFESLHIKKQMIEKDEFDQKERRVFNYGHTFGHALEAATKYAISHGNAVTLGLDMANHISLQMGLIKKEEYNWMFSILEKNIPVYKMSKQEKEVYFEFLFQDKKNINNSLVCILPHAIGDIRVVVLDNREQIKDIILEYMGERL